MRVEALAIALRPRQGWEAIDLGFRMAMHWARSLWTTWLVVAAPFALAVIGALAAEPLAAAIVLWWMKPVFDRFALFVLSRHVFGESPRLAQTLAAWRQVLSPGLARRLLLRPLAWDRSFLDPIPLLERQRGRAARQRAALLGRRFGGHAMALALVCLGFEVVVMVVGMLLVDLLQPAAQVGEAGIGQGSGEGFAGFGWTLSLTVSYAVAVLLIEPLYVAAGFAMYLSRRTALEGWDIELELRRAAQQRAPERSAGAPVRCAGWLGLALCLALAVPEAPALAASASLQDSTDESAPLVVDPDQDKPAKRAQPAYRPLETAARAAALEVLAHPEFGRSFERKRWRFPEPESADAPDLEWLRHVGDWIAGGLRLGAWLLLALLIVALAWLATRRFSYLAAEAQGGAAPATLFGMAIAPESLPDDVAAAALAALAAGRQREAVSLLYRGALSFLVHDCGMRIGEGATEGEVLAVALPLLPREAGAQFRALLAAWVEIAYGHRALPPESLRALCTGHRQHFGRGGAVAWPAAEGLPA